jgi:hypothetical protein
MTVLVSMSHGSETDLAFQSADTARSSGGEDASARIGYRRVSTNGLARAKVPKRHLRSEGRYSSGHATAEQERI